jgi:multidrug efflux pump subunit AcrA (membrane-fusion protein)
MARYSKFIPLAIVLVLLFSACKSNKPAEEVDQLATGTPVTVTALQDSTLSEYVELSAVSAYLEKSFVKANINGYVQKANAKTGKQVQSGNLLFALVTKEARAIGNTINKLDSGFKFTGVSSIRSKSAGVILQVNHQAGDYVQDGEALATISNRNSLVFLLDLPYELNKVIKANKSVNVLLPDGTNLKGQLSGTMPAVDSLAQTQRYIIKVGGGSNIPEGLIAKVRLTKANHAQTRVLPKSAVLSNDTEDQFWVMKLINDSTAVKVIIKKGIESSSSIEILEPKFTNATRIISTGNYGLADTAKVKIQRLP